MLVAIPYTISDTAGNSYVDAGPGVILFNSSGAWSEVFYALNTHTTASNVVKLSPASGLLNYPRIVAVEFTGGATSSPVDGGSGVGYSSKANATGGSSGANCLTATQLTPVTNGDLILAGSLNSNGTVHRRVQALLPLRTLVEASAARANTTSRAQQRPLRRAW